MAMLQGTSWIEAAYRNFKKAQVKFDFHEQGRDHYCCITGIAI